VWCVSCSAPVAIRIPLYIGDQDRPVLHSWPERYVRFIRGRSYSSRRTQSSGGSSVSISVSFAGLQRRLEPSVRAWSRTVPAAARRASTELETCWETLKSSNLLSSASALTRKIEMGDTRPIGRLGSPVSIAAWDRARSASCQGSPEVCDAVLQVGEGLDGECRSWCGPGWRRDRPSRRLNHVHRF
jgi:hypothetical protein